MSGNYFLYHFCFQLLVVGTSRGRSNEDLCEGITATDSELHRIFNYEDERIMKQKVEREWNEQKQMLCRVGDRNPLHWISRALRRPVERGGAARTRKMG